MHLPRTGVTGVLRPLVILMSVVLVGGCGATSSGAPPTPSPVATSPAPSPSVEVTPTGSAPASPTPGKSATPPPPTPTESPLESASPSPSGPDAVADGCSGSADTRDFFAAIAEAVDWDVFCAVLPAGWRVDSGKYALANGGHMVIAYKTNTGAHLELKEGHWCTDGTSACSPHDTDLGPIAVGGHQGELMSLGGDSGLVVYVDPGAIPSWTMTASGIDEATFRQLVGALILVAA